MTAQYDRLKALLEELFQLDQPDLDFGIYRVLRAKSAEIKSFLERDLLPQIKAAFQEYQHTDVAQVEQDLAKAIDQARSLGADPNILPRVKELRARLSGDAADVDALESEVYDRLYSFFRRYYSEGDFLAKRVYREGVYAIPYEGEEVKLYWANDDQYYIKTNEDFRDYAFCLKPNDKENPMRVHLRPVEVAEGEHGNVLSTEEKKRVFVLASPGKSGHEFMLEENGELVILFEYRQARIGDWGDNQSSKAKAPNQRDLVKLATQRVLAITASSLTSWITELKRLAPTESDPQRTVLHKHIKKYSDINTFDYFIHKDLGGFLKRELDFFIKNEVMRLDDVERATRERLDQYLSKIRVIRAIAGKIIEFLAQLENFQKKLWLKKKFVLETNYCITLGSIPDSFYPAIAANLRQTEEWVRLCGINEIAGDLVSPPYSEPLSIEFLKAHPSLAIDTKHFPQEWVSELIASFDDLDNYTSGLLIQAENFQALELLRQRYEGEVKCTYIDPPYNAKSSEIAYKNTYKHSSWLALMDNRISATLPLLGDDSVFVCAIDEVEQEVLGLLLGEIFSNKERTCVTIVHNATGQQGNNFSSTHEYAYFVYPASGQTIGVQDRTENPDVRPLRNVSKGAHLRATAANCFFPVLVKDGQIVGFGDVSDDSFHPAGINVTREDGTVEVYPIDPHGNERKWVFARDTVETILSELQPKRDPRTKDWDIIRTKSKFNFKTVWTDPRYSANTWGSRLLNEILGPHPFTFPKSIYTVRDCVDAALGNARTGLVLDYFGGSGTTAHAVILLNREDGGNRQFVLVEAADYFDSVLLPRVKKIAYTPEWHAAKPKRLATSVEANRGPRVIKYVRLESYEDSLNNLEVRRTADQQLALESPETSRGFREDYVLKYMLDVETRGSQSLLNVDSLNEPTRFQLSVRRPGSAETVSTNVDLIETFNFLLGLHVQRISAPRTVAASTQRDDGGRLRLKGALKENRKGKWWFQSVEGRLPDGTQALIIWRNLTGDLEGDNLVLDQWFKDHVRLATGSEFQVVYVNGSNNLEILRGAGEIWRVRLIEAEFQMLMFGGEE